MPKGEWRDFMSKVTDLVSQMVTPILEENNLELWNTELVKEGKNWFLRVYIDKPGKDEYISTDECELVSRALSAKLDEKDPIEQNYYLEVSSPGMDRELTKKEHFDRYQGEMVDVKLYKALDSKKEFEGKLISRSENGDITLEIPEGKATKELLISSELISQVKLAIIF